MRPYPYPRNTHWAPGWVPRCRVRDTEMSTCGAVWQSPRRVHRSMRLQGRGGLTLRWVTECLVEEVMFQPSLEERGPFPGQEGGREEAPQGAFARCGSRAMEGPCILRQRRRDVPERECGGEGRRRSWKPRQPLACHQSPFSSVRVTWGTTHALQEGRSGRSVCDRLGEGETGGRETIQEVLSVFQASRS